MGTGASGFEDILGLRSNRGFGAVEIVSDRTLSPFSRAGQQAADNLLTKAKRWFACGEDARAAALVDRAAALPYDSHEDAAPAALSAHLMLFSAVTDEVERSDPSDRRWLEAALSVLETCEDTARCTLRDVLHEIRQDYELGKEEEGAIDAATKSVPARAELRDLGPLPPEDLSPHVVATLRATIAYEASMERGATDDAVP